MLLQFVMLREFSTILTGIDLVVLLLGGAFFAGCSVGYAASDRLSARHVEVALLALFVLHLTLPFAPRWLAGWLAFHRAGHHALPAMLFIAAFLMSSVYSIFLPRLIGSQSPPAALSRCYATEVIGSIVGLVVVGSTMWAGHLRPLMLAYFLVLTALIALVRRRPALVAASLVCVVAYGLAFPALDRLSVEYFFRHTKGFTVARSLFQWYSPYQKVDVLEDQRGDRFLYLDGLLYFGPSKLEAFNFFLSELPARLRRPSRVLIVGSGSMSSVGHVAPFAGAIQTVELDAAVADAGRRFFARENRLSEVPQWTLIIDDAKHFLGSHPDEKYDLVIMDVPMPTTVQTAMLHSHEFYALVGRHLTPRGVVSVSLSGELRPDNATPRAVAASVLRAFPQAWAVSGSSARQSFALAGYDVSFSRRDIEAVLAARPHERFMVFDRERMQAVVGDAVPISIRRMDVVLAINLRRVGRTYVPGLMKGS